MSNYNQHYSSSGNPYDQNQQQHQQYYNNQQQQHDQQQYYSNQPQQQQYQYNVSNPMSNQSSFDHNNNQYGGGGMGPDHNNRPFMVSSPVFSNKYQESTSSYFSGAQQPHRYFYESNITFNYLVNNLMNDGDAKILSMWIVVMFCFTIYEIFYGAYLESLGLVSDGFHKLFDCIGFIISLLSMLVGKKKQTNRDYTYGYDRWEILGVFSNGCFLLFVSFFLFLESVERILEPPHIHNHGRVISLAIISLIINLVGYRYFKRFHVLNGTNKTRQDNISAISHHMLADGVTSICVILSTLIGQTFELVISDSLISIIIACIIVYDVLPICMRTGKILLQTTPDTLGYQIHMACDKVNKIDGVLSIKSKHFWTHSHTNYVGTLNILIREDGNEQQILKLVKNQFQFINSLTVQIEKEHVHHHHEQKHDEHDHHEEHNHHDHHDGHNHHGHSHNHNDDHDHHGHSHNHNDDHNHHGHSHNH